MDGGKRVAVTSFMRLQILRRRCFPHRLTPLYAFTFPPHIFNGIWIVRPTMASSPCRVRVRIQRDT